MSKVKNLRGERWKLIQWPSPPKGKEYFISNQGRAKSISKNTGSERLIKTHPDHRGFYRASIKGGNDKNQALYVHKQVALAFVKPKSKKHSHIIHKDIDRSNNHFSNVYWANDEEWREYVRARAKKYGFERSTAGGNFKLKSEDVAQIKKRLKNRQETYTAIAKEFGVSITQIKRIEDGQSWKSVKAAK